MKWRPAGPARHEQYPRKFAWFGREKLAALTDDGEADADGEN